MIDRAGARPGEDPWIGCVLAERYRIVRHLADGGMSRVYVGEQLRLGMPVAIKILDAGTFGDPVMVERFEREAIATAQLHSPHVVQVFDWGIRADGSCYLVMELVPGSDLATLLMRGGLLGVERTLGVLRQVALALDHAHALGIVHRDLKPENLVVDEVGGDFVKILDFGVARDLHARAIGASGHEIVGTPEYMAPEQAQGHEERVGPSADLYALGAIALEMITGYLPYATTPLPTMLRTIAESPPRLPSELGVTVPGLDALFERALARRSEERHGSARELVDALSAVLMPDGPQPRRPGDASGIRPRSVASAQLADASDAGAREALALAALSLPPPPIAPAIALPTDDEPSSVRVAATVVLAGLALVGSAFAAGWAACLALASG